MPRRLALALGFALLACRGPSLGLDDEAGTSTSPEGTADAGESESGESGFDPLACGSWDPPAATPAGMPPPEQACPDEGPCPIFVDVTREAGLDTLQYIPTHPADFACIFTRYTASGPSPHQDCEPQWFTGGVTVGDVDDDGWPDVYMTRLAAPDHLFLNQGDGTFVDVAAEVGLGECSYTNGAQFGDIDNDGDADLFVTGMGSDRHYLYINQLRETSVLAFEEQGESRGAAMISSVLHAGQSVTFGDYDRDGWLDAYVSEWLRTPLYPADESEHDLHGGRLLHNLGPAQPGVFEDVTAAMGVELRGSDERGVFAFSAGFVDLDRDGWQDLAVAVDFHNSRLFWNIEGQYFLDGTSAAQVNRESNAMGSAFGDLDYDTYADWYVTSIAQQGECLEGDTPPCWLATGNRFYLNQRNRVFLRQEDVYGVRDGAWAWGTALLDVDNDGDLDLTLANGWPGRDLEGGFYHLDTPMKLWMNQGLGVPMREEGQLRGVDDRQQGRGLLGFDYDRDGDLDLLVANHAGRPKLLRNEGGNQQRWLRVVVEGKQSNRDGRGARVVVSLGPDQHTLSSEVGVGSHFLGEGELVQHFGLAGQGEVQQVEVWWPATGQGQFEGNVAANQTLTFVEP